MMSKTFYNTKKNFFRPKINFFKENDFMRLNENENDRYNKNISNQSNLKKFNLHSKILQKK